MEATSVERRYRSSGLSGQEKVCVWVTMPICGAASLAADSATAGAGDEGGSEA